MKPVWMRESSNDVAEPTDFDDRLRDKLGAWFIMNVEGVFLSMPIDWLDATVRDRLDQIIGASNG